jgi:hypothetical protein
MKSNKGDLSYAQEKFSNAVFLLATDKGNIKDRLFHAFLEFRPVNENDLPIELREEYSQIKYCLTNIKSSGSEGTLIATLKKMKPARAAEIAKQIYNFMNKINSYYFERKIK